MFTLYVNKFTDFEYHWSSYYVVSIETDVITIRCRYFLLFAVLRSRSLRSGKQSVFIPYAYDVPIPLPFAFSCTETSDLSLLYDATCTPCCARLNQDKTGIASRLQHIAIFLPSTLCGQAAEFRSAIPIAQPITLLAHVLPSSCAETRPTK